MSAFEKIYLSISILTLIVLTIGLLFAVITMKADHERKKKQATVETAGKIWSDFRQELYSIFPHIEKDALTREDLENLKKNYRDYKNLMVIFGKLEYMAVGFNNDIYHKETLFNMSGSLLVLLYHHLKPFIDSERKEIPDKNTYIQFEHLAIEFYNKIRSHPPDTAIIEYS